MKRTKDTVVVLHNVRSVYNVGSIFRTADAAGVSKIFLTGYTPTPIDRFGRLRKDIKKTALGAEETVDWEYMKDPKVLIQKLKRENFETIAVEQAPDAEDYRTATTHGSIALVLGNEVRGLSPQLIAACDRCIEIPLYGEKESLNVSVAAGIVLFALKP